MITVIRRYFKSSSQLVLWIVMAAFVIGLMPAAFRYTSQSGQWAIRVNGQDIGYRDFVHEVNKQKQQIMAFRMQYGEYADWLLSTMGMNHPQTVAFRTLVREELINQFGGSLGINLNPSYVIAQMGNSQFIQDRLGKVVPAQIVDKLGGIDHNLLHQYLKYSGLTGEMFERQIERALMESIVSDLVQASLYVPEFDIKQKYRSDHAKKNFSLLAISREKLLAQAQKSPVTREELETFFDEQNKQLKRYWVPEQRSGTLWTFDPKDYHIAISDEQLESYYEKNKVAKFVEQQATVQVRRILFKVPNESARASVQDRIGRLRDEMLPDPSKFAEFAKSQSEDEKTASNGGLLAPFAKGSQEPIVDRTAFLMKNDGEISSVIETQDGYEMLQRVAKTPQLFKSLASVKQEIKDEQVSKKFDELFAADMQRVIGAQNDGKNEQLASFVKEKGGIAQQLNNQTYEKSPIAEHLFKLKSGEVSFFVEADKGMVLVLTDIQERYLPSFNSLEAQVKKDYYAHKTEALLAQRLKEAKEASGNSSFDKLQKAFDGTVIHTGWLESNKDQSAESLQKRGIPVDKMLQLEKPNSVLTHISDEYGYLMRLDEISDLNEEQYGREKAVFAEAFINERNQQCMEGFVASLHRNATIETNELLVTPQE